MAHSIRTPLARQLDHLRTSFAQQPGLPFADLLPDDTLELLGPTTEPLYSPLVTLRLFLTQVLDPVGSCQQAVARFLAWLTAQGLPACSANTGAYCKARQRLPEDGLHTLTRHTGATLSHKTLPSWLWKGRRVRVVDGTTVTAPDTPANQHAYPQPEDQKPGLGFPMIRLVVLFCLATGAVLEAALAPYRGRGTGELSLLRQIWDQLDRGDVLLGDRLYCSYFEIALLAQRGVDVVVRKHQSRRTDFRTGRRWGRHDHVIEWSKPTRPDWLDEATYAALPATLEVREVRIVVSCAGFRVKQFEGITTVVDAHAVSASELGELIRRRWEAELHLRSLQSVLGLDQLRCQSPSMVRKELWVTLVGYNLVRGVMAESASRVKRAPRRVSFAGAVQTLLAFGPVLLFGDDASVAGSLSRLWAAVGSHRVGGRPDRVEPRAIKRRKKSYPALSEPRNLARQRLGKTK